MVNKKILFVFSLFLALLLYYIVNAKQKESVDITIHNPYSGKIQLRIKCDWSNRRKDFLLDTLIFLKGKDSITMRISKKYNKCDVWPKVVSLF